MRKSLIAAELVLDAGAQIGDERFSRLGDESRCAHVLSEERVEFEPVVSIGGFSFCDLPRFAGFEVSFERSDCVGDELGGGPEIELLDGLADGFGEVADHVDGFGLEGWDDAGPVSVDEGRDAVGDVA